MAADVATFTSALQLSEAIYQLTLDRMQDRRFAPTSLDIVNDAAVGPVPTVELSDADLHLSGDLRSALAHVASVYLATLSSTTGLDDPPVVVSTDHHQW
ncbi:hypothetical protein EJK15_28630 [Nonomuraea basaltis]|nr:hypothetical protein [Nonomuraea basaltis]TMR95474.1 hypothetical protein EJK15_28630 [Nonomuraea basaltis]